MTEVEGSHALDLVLSQLSKTNGGRKLKVGMDVDDTAARTSEVVRDLMKERHGFDFSLVGNKYDWSSTGATDKHFMDIYNELWQRDGEEIEPILGRETFALLNEKVEFSFVSARGGNSSDGLYKWIYRHYGKTANVVVVNPEPYDMHGIRKLERGFDILIDDSPYVAATMKDEIARNRALLLVNRWEEAVACRHEPNTAVVKDAEHAARVIFEARSLHVGPMQE